MERVKKSWIYEVLKLEYLLNALAIRYRCQMICRWTRGPETLLESTKKVTFLKVISKPIIYKFVKDFTKFTKETNWGVVFYP